MEFERVFQIPSVYKLRQELDRIRSRYVGPRTSEIAGSFEVTGRRTVSRSTVRT